MAMLRRGLSWTGAALGGLVAFLFGLLGAPAPGWAEQDLDSAKRKSADAASRRASPPSLEATSPTQRPGEVIPKLEAPAAATGKVFPKVEIDTTASDGEVIPKLETTPSQGLVVPRAEDRQP